MSMVRKYADLIDKNIELGYEVDRLNNNIKVYEDIVDRVQDLIDNKVYTTLADRETIVEKMLDLSEVIKDMLEYDVRRC